MSRFSNPRTEKVDWTEVGIADEGISHDELRRSEVKDIIVYLSLLSVVLVT